MRPSATGSFRVHAGSSEAGVYSILLAGELGLEEGRLLDRTLTYLVRDGAKTIVLDVAALSAVGGGLAGILERANTRIGWRNGRLAVVGATGGIARDLRLAGLEDLLTA
jgi:anti-anti-sigma regulatory factor